MGNRWKGRGSGRAMWLCMIFTMYGHWRGTLRPRAAAWKCMKINRGSMLANDINVSRKEYFGTMLMGYPHDKLRIVAQDPATTFVKVQMIK
jgi:hypothetical protein